MNPRREMENESSKRYPDFFKVFLPARNSHRLHIPDGYEAGCGRTLPKKVMLSNHMGKCWHVDVAHTEKGVHFVNGWHKFAQDNSLQYGDFLIFKYDGNSGFYVKYLGQFETENGTSGVNGISYLNQLHLVQYEELEDQEEKDDDDDDDDDDESDDDNDGDYNEEDTTEEEDDDEDEEEEDYDDALTSGKRRNKTGGFYGSKKRAVDKKGGSKKSYHFMVEEATPVIKKNNEQKKMRDNKGGSKKKSVERTTKSKNVQLRNPQFIAKLRTGSKKHLLLVPSQVLKRHKLDLPELMIFQNEHGSQWPGHTLYWADGRTWISGWSAFCKWNNVSLDDCCVCEFLPGCNGQNRDTIKVKIIHNAGSGS